LLPLGLRLLGELELVLRLRQTLALVQTEAGSPTLELIGALLLVRPVGAELVLEPLLILVEDALLEAEVGLAGVEQVIQVLRAYVKAPERRIQSSSLICCVLVPLHLVKCTGIGLGAFLEAHAGKARPLGIRRLPKLFSQELRLALKERFCGFLIELVRVFCDVLELIERVARALAFEHLSLILREARIRRRHIRAVDIAEPGEVRVKLLAQDVLSLANRRA